MKMMLSNCTAIPPMGKGRTAAIAKTRSTVLTSPLKNFYATNGLYRNRPQSWKYGKEAPQNFWSERATIAERQGASENENYEAKPTQPDSNFGTDFGIAPGPQTESQSKYPKTGFITLATGVITFPSCFTVSHFPF